MAKETHDDFFLGTDFERDFHILNDEEDTAIDINAWALSWMVKRYHADADVDALLTKTTAGGAIVIAGVFNANPDVNLQRATLTVTDDATDTEIPPGVYAWELKRTDDGFETVLAYGTLECVQGVHR